MDRIEIVNQIGGEKQGPDVCVAELALSRIFEAVVAQVDFFQKRHRLGQCLKRFPIHLVAV